MKRLQLPLAFGMLLLTWQGTLLAQPQEPMEARTFSVPHNFLFTDPSYLSAIPSDPIGYSPSEPRTYKERMESLRQIPKPVTAREILTAQGIEFPKGARALFQSASQTLTVYNTPANLDLVASFVDAVQGQGPHLINVSAYLVQAPGSTLRPLAANAGGDKDQTQDLQRLVTMSDHREGDVQILHTAFLELRQGQRSVFENQSEHEYTQKLALDAKGRASVEAAMRPLGFSFEVEVDFVEHRDAIDLNFSSDLTLLWEKAPQETVSEPISGGPVELPLPVFQTAHMLTALSLRSGQSRLISIWPAKGDPKLQADDMSQALFITARRVPQILTLASPAKAPSKAPPDPQAIIEQSFKLPLEIFDANTSTDPASIQELLSINGIKLPAGSHVRLDEKKRLIVKTNVEMMSVVEAWAQQYLNTFPKTVSMTVEIIRAPASLVRPLLLESADRSDHTPALKKLRDAIGQARQASLTCLDVKDRQRAKTQSYLDRHFLVELGWKSSPQPVLATMRREVGLILEVEPIINANQRSVDLTYVLERHFAPIIPWEETLSDPASKRRFVMPRNEFPRAKIQTTNTFMDGSTKIIGVWRPVGEGGKISDEDILEMAFMTCKIVHQVPEIAASKTAREQGPKRPPGATGDPNQMFARIFKVPPNFFAITALPSPPTETLAGPPQPMPRGRHAIDILKEHGIPFPDGASAIGGITSQLIVKNTETNLAKVEEFIREITEQDIRSLPLTLHLLEAPASVVQNFLALHSRENNHAATLKGLLAQTGKGSVRSLATLNVTTKSGQRATVSQVQEQSFLKAITVSDQDSPDIVREDISVGSSFEVEPTLSTDGLMLELSCTLTHHPAVPVIHVENLAAAGAPRIEVPLTDYHVESLQTSVTMPTGTARILTVWKPTGKPEFETQDLLHIAILEVGVLEAQ